MSTKPSLIQHFARVPAPPPYEHRGASVHSFSLSAPLQSLQDLCDAWFDKASGSAVRYTVLLPKLFVMVANIAEVQPGDPAHADLGITSEIDVGLWLLALRTWPFSPVPRWIPVRLLVDSADAVVVGREVFGFPKEMGRMNIPSTAPSAGPFDVQAFVTPAAYQRMAWKDVINIRSVGPAGPVGSVWATVDEATQAVVDELLAQMDFGWISGLIPAAAMRAGFRPGLFPFAFLKQFMAIDAPDEACHQSIVEAQSRLLAFRRGGFTRERFEVLITSHHTHPFHQFLGITPGWQPVGRAIWSDFDFMVEAGSVLHQS